MDRTLGRAARSSCFCDPLIMLKKAKMSVREDGMEANQERPVMTPGNM